MGKDNIKYIANGYIEYSDQGIVLKRVLYDTDRQPHHPTAPARTEYYRSGARRLEEYYWHGKRHRELGPATIWYDKTGKVTRTSYWCHGKSSTVDTYLQLILDSPDPTAQFCRIVEYMVRTFNGNTQHTVDNLALHIDHLVDADIIRRVRLLLPLAA